MGAQLSLVTRIEGAKWHPFGSGGSKQSGASEDPNTLKTDVIATFVDVLSVGEIEGLVNGAQSIYFNNTPLQNSDGSYNFNGVTWDIRTGTPNQSYITGLDDGIGTEQDVGTEVRQDTPITVTISDDSINRVVVKVEVPTLTSTDTKSGNIHGSSVQLEIFTNGVSRITDTISGKCTSPYIRAYDISLAGETFPVEVKVQKLTADSSSEFLQNSIAFYSYSEVIDKKLTYPNIAYIQVTIDAAQFGDEIPTRTYDCKLLKVHIPSNYDPIGRTYSGVWDGTFQVAWTDNPVWLAYELINNNIFGLGSILKFNFVEKYSCYQIAQYCDVLVNNGNGGQEPRYTFNGVITQADKAETMINNVLSCFRGFTFTHGGALYFGADMPSDPIAIYTPANVVNGQFNYSTTDFNSRCSIVNVTWNDPSNNYAPTLLTVDDPVLVDKLGQITIGVYAYGCTSAGQAARFGKNVLFTVNNQTKVCSFDVGLSGLIRKPGDVILIADPVVAGAITYAKVAGVVGSTATVDRPVTISPGVSYTIKIIQEDSSVFITTITNSPGTYTALTLDEAPSGTIIHGADCTIETPVLKPTQWMVTSVSPNGDGTWSLGASNYIPEKYNFIENNVSIPPPQNSLYPDYLKSSPQNLKAGVNGVVADNTSWDQIFVEWDKVPGANAYLYQYNVNDGNYTPMQTTQLTSFEFNGIEGTYNFKVCAVDFTGRKTLFATLTQEVTKSLIQIPDVTNFTSVRQNQDVIFSWDPVNSGVFDHYEVRRGTTWSTAQVVGTPRTTSFSVSEPNAATYFIKAVSFYGNYSVNEAETNTLQVPSMYVTFSQDEKALGFPGTKNHFTVNGSGYLEADENNTYSYITNSIDIGAILTARLSTTLVIEADRDMTVEEFESIYVTIAGIPAGTTIDGNPNAISANFSISTSLDNSTWTPFITYFPGFKKYRYIKIRLDVSRSDGSVLPVITAMSFSFDLIALQEAYNNFAVSDTGSTKSYANSYVIPPNVQAAVQDGQPGDTIYKNTGLTSTQFFIHDNAGNAKSGLIDIAITGY